MAADVYIDAETFIRSPWMTASRAAAYLQFERTSAMRTTAGATLRLLVFRAGCTSECTRGPDG